MPPRQWRNVDRFTPALPRSKKGAPVADAWLASLGAGAAPTPPSLTAPEPPSEGASMGASQARHASPETTSPPAAPDDGTAARQAPLSLAQQQRAFIDGLAHALTPRASGA